MRNSLLACTALVILLAGGCGSGSNPVQEEQSENSKPQLEYPHPDHAVLVDATRIGDDELEFVGSNGIASLHIIEEHPMQVYAYYSAQQPREDGWNGGSVKGTEYFTYNMMFKDKRTAIITIVSAKVINQVPDVAKDIDFDPFDVQPGDFNDDQTLVFMKVGTCDAPSALTCRQDVFAELNPDVGE